MADTTRTDGSDAPSCTTCSSIPSNLLVNTGRDETFPDEVRRLVWLEVGDSYDLRRCPECGALFEWEDMPQFYGSGNNDEERLTRLDPARASMARELLDPEPGARDDALLYAQAFRTLSPGLVCEILRHLAYKNPRVFAGFLAPIVAQLAVESDFALVTIVTSYCGLRRDRLVELDRLLDAAGTEPSQSIAYLRKTCAERLAEAVLSRGADVRRTSQQVAAELHALLKAVCQSYADRRAHPPAEPAYDMADFMHVCWDFAAHAVDMLQAGRHEELAPAFRAMAVFRDRSTEHWMRNGLAPVFERIWDEGKWRDVDVRPLESVIEPSFLDEWRHIEDPDDGHPYPIDGFY